MAVQKSKKSRSKRGMRRANAFTKLPAMTVESFTGETVVRHHVSEQGYKNGKKVLLTKKSSEDKAE